MIHIKVDNKKLLYQIVLFIIISNLFVYLLSYDSNTAAVEKTKTFKDYQSVVANLNLYVPFQEMTEVKLWDPRKKILLNNVFLYKKVSHSSIWKKKQSEFIVKIKNKDLSNYLEAKNNTFDAYPVQSQLKTKKSNSGRTYEMAF